MNGDDGDDDDDNNNNRANHRGELLYRLNTMQTDRHARDAFQYTRKHTVYERAEPRHEEEGEEEEEEEKQRKRKMIKLMVMKCKVSFRKLVSSV